MSTDANFYFGLNSNQYANEFVQHIMLVREMINDHNIFFEQAKIYRGSISDKNLVHEIKDLDESALEHLESIQSSENAIVTDFEVRRMLHERMDPKSSKIETTDEGLLAQIITVGKRSPIHRPFGFLNTRWYAGNRRIYDERGSKRTFQENRHRLFKEMDSIAGAADHSLVFGRGREWPDNPNDVYLMALSKNQFDLYEILDLADRFESVVVDERENGIFIYNAGSWNQSIQGFAELLSPKLTTFGVSSA